jgi:phosphoadenosine phosphosulfate reductase
MSLERRVAATRERLAAIARNHAPAAFASSFGAEDMVLVDLIARGRLTRIEVLTLDTGRLPRETHALIETVRERYGLPIASHAPRVEAVEAYVAKHGLDGFYDSLDARKACCRVRKIEPLRRALVGKRAWITGLRRGQSDTRAEIPLQDFDAAHDLWKFNPLAEWSDDDVWTYLKQNDVPYNALHDRGYPSIGCEPCTRAVKPGEHPRAGRWWWEQEGARKECGLHAIPVRVA